MLYLYEWFRIRYNLDVHYFKKLIYYIFTKLKKSTIAYLLTEKANFLFVG